MGLERLLLISERMVSSRLVLGPDKLKAFIAKPIDIATPVSGFLVGFVGVIADLTGAIGGGSGLLISAGTISDVAEKGCE
eukprot:gnl/Chilomastix_caulleri/7140.p1 GENE.gnl/Chilomastix_caulleri/7140~~gnl/Chilomastix_caulleri/7140.p1  ORF type:complete len:80 (+),score=26.30 gnl/Chilomastix_caulleri/7140:131-370(+)